MRLRCRRTGGDGVERLEGRIEWEDRDAEPDLVVIEAGADAAAALSDGPEALVAAAFSLAILRGEERLLVEGPVCPDLRNGLAAIGARLAVWHPDLRVPAVEAAGGLRPLEPSTDAGAALFLSGGVDAFALLEENLRLYPADHPGRFTVAIHVFGFGSFDHLPGSEDPDPKRLEEAARYADRLDSFCRERGIRLIRVRSNARALFPDFDAWARVGWTLNLVSTGVAFDRAVRELWIASDGLLRPPPLTEQLFWMHLASTSATRVAIGQGAVSRIEKVRRLGGWHDVHGLLRVCPQYHEVLTEGRLNCGRCEKCLRTMLEMVVSDARPALQAFRTDDVEPGDLADLGMRPLTAPFFRALVPRLEDVGRLDLAGALRQELARFDASLDDGPRRRSVLRRMFGPR